MPLFNLTRWPSLLILLLAGASIAVFAFVSVNLFSHAMANLTFMQKYGWAAIQHGALWQVLELCLWGAVALFCWLTFKICESILKDRYLHWAEQPSPDPTKNPAQERRGK